MSDFAYDIDAELGETSLPSGVHLSMQELHRPYCAEVCGTFCQLWNEIRPNGRYVP